MNWPVCTSQKQESSKGRSSTRICSCAIIILIYVNDICDDLNSDSFLFADDTSIFKVENNNILQAAKIINEDLDQINSWTTKWLVSINTTKTIFMMFSKKRQSSNVPPLLLGTHSLSKVNEHKYWSSFHSKPELDQTYSSYYCQDK